MNLFERYILASVMTNRYIHDDATYKEWIEDYKLHLKRINEEIENERWEVEDEKTEI